MSLTPLDIYKKLDPKFQEDIKKSNDFAFAEGSLPRKVKFLIAMALDASHGAVQGVKSLASAAMQQEPRKRKFWKR